MLRRFVVVGKASQDAKSNHQKPSLGDSLRKVLMDAYDNRKKIEQAEHGFHPDRLDTHENKTTLGGKKKNIVHKLFHRITKP